MRKTLLAILAATILLPTAIHAADMRPPTKAAPPPMAAQVFDWSGIYVGLQVGGAFANWETGNVSINGFPIGVSAGDFHASGAVFGANLGWQRQMGNIVVGVEADLQKANIESTRTVLAIIDVRTKWDYYGTARAKLGYAMGPVLLYATGGFAWGKDSPEVSILGLISSSHSDTHTGWTAGAGLDFAVTPNFIFGVAYKHLDLGGSTHSFAFGPITVGVPSEHKIDEVTLRGSWKF